MRRMTLSNGRPVDNFVPYDTELYEKVKETKFSPEERQIIDTVIRETVGYESRKSNKDVSIRLASKPLSVRRMMDLTGLKRMTTHRWAVRLINRNILLQSWAFCPKRQWVLGINFEFWQWDSKGDFIAIGEYLKLKEKAKAFIKEELERRYNCRFVKPKRRDKVDFKMLRGVNWYGAVVTVKTGWDGAHNIGVRIEDPKPNTYYFFVDKDITTYLIIQPSAVEEEEIKIARPVINTAYLDIPKENVVYQRGSSIIILPSPPRASPNEVMGITTH